MKAKPFVRMRRAWQKLDLAPYRAPAHKRCTWWPRYLVVALAFDGRIDSKAAELAWVLR